MPLKLVPKLKEIFPNLDFLEFDVVEDLHDKGRHLVIIDAADGIDSVCLIEDLDALETSHILSMHDFDLAYNLKLMKKTRMIENVKIFCIPAKITKKAAIEQLVPLIRSTLF